VDAFMELDPEGAGALLAMGVAARGSSSPENGFSEQAASVAVKATVVSRRLFFRLKICRNMMIGVLHVMVCNRMLFRRCYNMSPRGARGCQIRHISGPEGLNFECISGGIV